MSGMYVPYIPSAAIGSKACTKLLNFQVKYYLGLNLKLKGETIYIESLQTWISHCCRCNRKQITYEDGNFSQVSYN